MKICKYLSIRFPARDPLCFAAGCAGDSRSDACSCCAGVVHGHGGECDGFGYASRRGDLSPGRLCAQQVERSPITVTQTTTLSPISMGGANPFPFSDPDSGTVKELDVLETVAPQTVTVVDTSATPATTIAQVIPSLISAVGGAGCAGDFVYVDVFELLDSACGWTECADVRVCECAEHAGEPDVGGDADEPDHRRRDAGLHLWADLYGWGV